MTLSTRFLPLKEWILYSDKPDKKGCFIKGLKDDAPDDIRILFHEYMSIINNRD